MNFSTTYVEKRTAKNSFFNQINIVINCKSVFLINIVLLGQVQQAHQALMG